jgi:hypothetical protein
MSDLGDWAWAFAIAMGVLIIVEQARYEIKESRKNKRR